MKNKPLVEDFIDEFVEELRSQLRVDAKRWGDTWLKRGIKGQEKRTMERYRDYYDQFKAGRVPLPWLKIIGGALICWVRERHPDIVENPDDDCSTMAV